MGTRTLWKIKPFLSSGLCKAEFMEKEEQWLGVGAGSGLKARWGGMEGARRV